VRRYFDHGYPVVNVIDDTVAFSAMVAAHNQCDLVVFALLITRLCGGSLRARKTSGQNDMDYVEGSCIGHVNKLPRIFGESYYMASGKICIFRRMARAINLMAACSTRVRGNRCIVSQLQPRQRQWPKITKPWAALKLRMDIMSRS
jgi:hypothetical protein